MVNTIFTLSKNENTEKLYLSDIIKEAVKNGADTKEEPPLIFFNTCQSGVSIITRDSNFFEQLFPKLSIGFINTFFNTGNTTAGEVAYNFYETFFNESLKMDLIDSLERAKKVAH